MTRFSPDRFNLRARPWLVLWLLPYLLLSIAAAGHNHGFGERQGSAPAAFSIALASETTASVANAIPVKAVHATHELWCLACQWAGFAAALVASPVFLALVAAAPLFALFSFKPSRRSPARAVIRGPPVS
jgi:hypothetical protein